MDARVKFKGVGGGTERGGAFDPTSRNWINGGENVYLYLTRTELQREGQSCSRRKLEKKARRATELRWAEAWAREDWGWDNRREKRNMFNTLACRASIQLICKKNAP